MNLKLLEDDLKQIYVWVRDDDHSVKVSPHFDYQFDAIQWYEKNYQRWDHYSDLPAPGDYL